MKGYAMHQQNTITAPDTTPQDEPFDPIVSHYVRNADIIRCYVTGEAVTALCGETWVTAADEELYTGPSVDCPLCALVLAEMRVNR